MRIVLYEDNHRDIESRYAWLNNKHDVIVNFYDHQIQDNRRQNVIKRFIIELEFNIEQINFITNFSHPVPADLYFVDGLNGKWIHAANLLPKDLVFIISGDDMVLRNAAKNGYNTGADKDIKYIVEEKERFLALKKI